jgi:hypothetical protein
MSQLWKDVFPPSVILLGMLTHLHKPLAMSIFMGCLAFLIVNKAIPMVSSIFLQKNLFGRDLLKQEKPVMFVSPVTLMQHDINPFTPLHSYSILS